MTVNLFAKSYQLLLVKVQDGMVFCPVDSQFLELLKLKCPTPRSHYAHADTHAHTDANAMGPLTTGSIIVIF